MPRGRSIDRTLPVTRTLTAQRDYRARKAAHQRDLEETVARLQSENDALRAEVAFLRAHSSPNGTHADTAPPASAPPPPPNPALAEQQLSAVAAAHAHLASALSALDGVMGATPARHPSNFTPQPPHVTPAPPRCYLPPSSAPPSEHSYMSASPSSSVSGMRSCAGPSCVPGLFDPACCDGLFDCSALPGMPISDMRSLPGPVQVQVQVPAPVPLGMPLVNGSGGGVGVHGVNGSHGGSSVDGGRSRMNGHDHGLGGAQEEDECCLGLVDCEPPT